MGNASAYNRCENSEYCDAVQILLSYDGVALTPLPIPSNISAIYSLVHKL